MLAVYFLPSTWIAIILAGIVGCIATAIAANLLKGVPFSAVGGSWRKHLWSIIYCIPVPLLLALPVGLVVAFVWLMLSPTIGSKAYFGPKDVPHMTLNTFHAAFAAAALVVYFLVTGAL